MSQDVQKQIEQLLRSVEKPPMTDQQALVSVVQTAMKSMVEMHQASLEQSENQFDRILSLIDNQAAQVMLSHRRRRGAASAGLAGHQPTTTGGVDGTPSAAEREPVDPRVPIATMTGFDPSSGFKPVQG